MANEEKKDFNAMLRRNNGMPRIQTVTDEATIRTYGGSRMLLAPPLAYDALMRRVPAGKLTTVGELRAHLARGERRRLHRPHDGGDLRLHRRLGQPPALGGQDPLLAHPEGGRGAQPQIPGGVEAQRARLEAEGHTVVQRGRKNLRYYVQDYEKALAELN